MTRTNRQWVLQKRPTGPVSVDCFSLLEQPAPAVADGQVLVKNLYLSCDPTQRGWIAGDTYLPAVQIGEVVRAFAVGEVLESRHPRWKAGDLVQGLFGWQELAAVPGSQASPVPPGVPLETSMSALGMTGLTAWFGLTEVGRPQAGETVVVSGAAGATGSVVGQIAKNLGCRTVGIAGGAAKCKRLVEELGFDAAIDYKSEPLGKRLRETCPKGIDVFFDNVGGEVLDAALARLALRGRVVLCGGISGYDTAQPAPGPRNYLNLVVVRGRMEGFLILDYLKRAPEAVAVLAGWMREGKLKDRVDVAQGIEQAPAALLRLFRGENDGKQLVKLG